MTLSRSLQTEIRRLHQRPGREQTGRSLAEGVRLVEEALAAGVGIRAAIVTSALEATPRGRRLAETLAARGDRVERVAEDELAALTLTEQPQGVLAVIEMPDWRLADLPAPPKVVLVLDGLQDPGNVGTTIRTAWSLGADGVVALPGTVELANPKVLRATAGAVFRFPVVSATMEIVTTWLADQGIPLWVAAPDGEPLDRSTLPPSLALAVGNEGAGAGAPVESVAARRVAVRLRPGAESLNVAIASGILLHEVLRDR